MPQTPLLHDALAALGASAHWTPQLPQLLTLVLTFVSQPSPGVLLQSLKPALQVKPHWPLVQLGDALVAGAQAWPHVPQLFVSPCRFTQFCPQLGVTSPTQDPHPRPSGLQMRRPGKQLPPSVPGAPV